MHSRDEHIVAISVSQYLRGCTSAMLLDVRTCCDTHVVSSSVRLSFAQYNFCIRRWHNYPDSLFLLTCIQEHSTHVLFCTPFDIGPRCWPLTLGMGWPHSTLPFAHACELRQWCISQRIALHVSAALVATLRRSLVVCHACSVVSAHHQLTEDPDVDLKSKCMP